MPDRMSDDRRWYEGTSAFLRWAPKLFLFMAVVMYLVHWTHWIQFSTTFVLVEIVGAFLYDDRRPKHWFGYPLLDGILYTPGRELTLRTAFAGRGYHFTES